jgi:hypothetical protein
MTDRIDPTRRRFLQIAAVTAAAAPAAGLLRGAHAADGPMVDPSSAQAQSLSYVENADKSTVRKNDNEYCRNCALYQGPADSDAAPCPLFPGKQVTVEGWCSAWAPKA